MCLPHTRLMKTENKEHLKQDKSILYRVSRTFG